MELMFFLNGEFVKASQAKVSVYDHGFLNGDGICETIRVCQGNLFQFEQYMERLFASLGYLNIESPYDKEIFLKTSKMLINMNGMEDAVLRIIITRGEGDFGLDIGLCTKPTVLIALSPYRPYPEKFYENGIFASIVSVRKPPKQVLPSNICSLSKLTNLLAREESKAKNCFEAIMLNLEGYVAEGSESNIFCIKDGQLLTPDISCGALKGVTRQIVMNLACSIGLDVCEVFLTPQDLQNSTECFLTSTLFGIMPVIGIEDQRIGQPKPGQITKVLMQKYAKLIRKQVLEENTELHQILTNSDN